MQFRIISGVGGFFFIMVVKLYCCLLAAFCGAGTADHAIGTGVLSDELAACARHEAGTTGKCIARHGALDHARLN